MPEHCGKFVGTVISTSGLRLPDAEDHEMRLLHVSGRHTAGDTQWPYMRMEFHVVVDSVAGSGKALGYFTNRHDDGSAAHGTFEAMVLRGGTMDGVYTFQTGTGRFADIQGKGTFEVKFSPLSVTMEWEGHHVTPSDPAGS